MLFHLEVVPDSMGESLFISEFQAEYHNRGYIWPAAWGDPNSRQMFPWFPNRTSLEGPRESLDCQRGHKRGGPLWPSDISNLPLVSGIYTIKECKMDHNSIVKLSEK